jgi:hypothetical protein
MNYRQTSDHRIFRVVRSTTGLIIIAAAIGLALAATIGAVVWVIASALHHASTA